MICLLGIIDDYLGEFERFLKIKHNIKTVSDIQKIIYYIALANQAIINSLLINFNFF